MTRLSWIPRLFARTAPAARKAPARYRPRLEALEDRTLLNSYLAATAADLINDINLANAAGGANTITLTAPPSSPYTLTAGDNTTDGATGLPVIAAGDNLTIVGNSDTIGRSTASATPAFRLLDVAAGATLTLQGLTLTDGLASGSGVSAQGGAIYSQGALTLNGVTVQNNTGGNGGEGLGGAIYVGSGAVTLNNSTLSGNAAQGGGGGAIYVNGGASATLINSTLSVNTAQAGGGLYNDGTVTLTNVTFSGNTARGADGVSGATGLGGAIFVGSGAVTLNNSTLSNNAAQVGGGGAIYVNGGASATLSNSTVSGNTAQGGVAQGRQNGVAGGLYNDRGTVTLTNVTVSGNSASYGAGGMFNLGTATLTNVTVSGNSAVISGGLHNQGAATLTNVTVSGNSALEFGGLFNKAAATLTNTIVAGNSASDAPDISGGYSGSDDLVGGDPKLAPLGDYGGPTQTMALLPGSPAIDAGDSTAPGLPSTDQRGFARISGAAVDIGAYEVQEPTLSPATLADGTYGAAYRQTLTATEEPGGAGGPFTLAVTAGTLPPGLSLDGTSRTLSGTAAAAGSFTFTVTATDSGQYTSSQVYTLTIDKADLYVTAAANSKTYGQTATDTGTLSGVVNGDGITATFASAGDAASAPVGTGSYAITATLEDPNNQLANYTVHETDAILTVNPAVLAVTAGNATRSYGAANPAFTYSITGFVNNDPASVVSGTPALSTTATPGSPVGGYAITADVSSLAAANYTFQPVSGMLTVTAAPLSATPVNVGATAGAPFRGNVATFTTPDQTDSAAAFTAVITWGDGSTSNGIITGSNGTFTVGGSHTYAAAGSYAVSVQISNPNTQSATTSDPASVTGLGRGVTSGMTAGIGFWDSNKGQALINSFNGGATATALGNWLAASFPNLYGAGTGANSLAGKTNAQVASYFQALFALGGTQGQAQVLATALNVYATTSSLGGNAGTAYGFAVSATGLGARSYSVGKDGAAFGVANNTTLNVYELLVAVNKRAKSGVLYGGNATLQAQCANLLNALNTAGK
jgi:hypothetical protein